MKLKILLIGLISLSQLTSVFAQSKTDPAIPNNMTLITFNERPAENIDAVRDLGANPKWLNMDGANNILADLYASIPDHLRATRNPNQETSDQIIGVLRKAFNDLNPVDKSSVLVGAYLKRWDLHRIPAMVFNEGESVIYGVTDFEEALSIWREKGASQ